MFSKRLKIARKNKKLTQDELAELISTTKSTISNYENEYSTPSLDVLLMLSSKLDVSVDYLLGNETSISTDNNFTSEELLLIKSTLIEKCNDIDKVIAKIDELILNQ